jgi:hypothetical protein
MTTQSRIVLDDCRCAFAQFREGIQGSEWRIWWITNVALLHAVYHVLMNIDKKYNPSSAGIFDSWNTNLKKQESAEAHKIFWKFIRKERNSLLKEYKPTAGQCVMAPSKLVEFDETGE